jgi:hypothetical protein
MCCARGMYCVAVSLLLNTSINNEYIRVCCSAGGGNTIWRGQPATADAASPLSSLYAQRCPLSAWPSRRLRPSNIERHWLAKRHSHWTAESGCRCIPLLSLHLFINSGRNMSSAAFISGMSITHVSRRVLAGHVLSVEPGSLMRRRLVELPPRGGARRDAKTVDVLYVPCVVRGERSATEVRSSPSFCAPPPSPKQLLKLKAELTRHATQRRQ